MKIKKLILTLPLLLIFIDCDNFLDIQPKGEVIPETLEDFRALMTNAYRENSFATSNLNLNIMFRTDQIKYIPEKDDSGDIKYHYLWNDDVSYPYQSFYKIIFLVNHILHKGNEVIKPSSEKEQLIGEALALRAYTYFILVNLYGKPYNVETAASDIGVPLVLEADMTRDFKPQSVQKVYDQILIDMEASQDHLNKSVPADHTPFEKTETGLNYRFSIVALYAMKARVNLYMKRYETAVENADKALSIKNTLVNFNKEEDFTWSDIPDAQDSQENLLALQVQTIVKLPSNLYVSEHLLNLYDQSDVRGYIYYYKEKEEDENMKILKLSSYIESYSYVHESSFFRVGELYLNKAEALLYMGSISESKTVLLELIKNRYNTANINDKINVIKTMDKEAYIAELFAERERELAFEGHRWFDLRRTTQKEIHHVYEGKDYILHENDSRYTLPFPKEAILINPFLNPS